MILNFASIKKSGPAAILGLSCLLLSLPALPDSTDIIPALHSGEGYVLIRIQGRQRERVGKFQITNVDTRESVEMISSDFRVAGAGGWMALIAAPEGRYFWSEFDSRYSISTAGSPNLDDSYTRSAPGSADDTFEIVAGVVNYVGDWTMRVRSSERRRLDPVIELNKATLERYLEEYPEVSTSHRIYVSMMGKESISLDELAKIIQSQQSN